jgi:hypothetical protein
MSPAFDEWNDEPSMDSFTPYFTLFASFEDAHVVRSFESGGVRTTLQTQAGVEFGEWNCIHSFEPIGGLLKEHAHVFRAVQRSTETTCNEVALAIFENLLRELSKEFFVAN